MQKVEIYDIDGCICKNVFPNLKKKVKIPETKKKILETPIFPAFINYFKAIGKNKDYKQLFLTGRKHKDYGKETIKQLFPLNINQNQIIFYPDHLNHSKERYITFKCYHILKNAYNHRDINCIVYDDLDTYQTALFEGINLLDLENIELKIIKDPKKVWEMKLREVLK